LRGTTDADVRRVIMPDNFMEFAISLLHRTGGPEYMPSAFFSG